MQKKLQVKQSFLLLLNPTTEQSLSPVLAHTVQGLNLKKILQISHCAMLKETESLASDIRHMSVVV